MLADVLQGFLDDTQDRGLLCRVEQRVRRSQVRLDGRSGERRHTFDRVHDRAVQAQLVEQRRPQLTDESSNLAEFAPQQLTEEPQLAGGHSDVFADDSLDVFDLEDGVRERLRRAVVDLLGEPGTLGFLSLDDPHLQVCRQPRVRDLREQAGIAALQEEPGVLHAPHR